MMLDFIYLMGLFYLFFGLDDFFIDIIYWCSNFGPVSLTQKDLEELRQKPQKKLAIMVASWKEQNVLERMVSGNIARLEYKNYAFFLGVYPNDVETKEKALDLEKKYDNVYCVINTEEGPTCKGQMINEMVRFIFKLEDKYDAVIFHDSEDLIHPLSLMNYNKALDQHDFIQLPIFSLPTSPFNLVAGTYMDEFAEIHTKDILVRSFLAKAIPSAGVGTVISRKLVSYHLKHNKGNLLNIGSLTEDYELGVSTPTELFSSTFLFCQFINKKGQKEIVATREYFPMSFKTSVKQKSRWILGISYQGFDHLGWFGSLSQRYFLYRDRKGPFVHFLVLLGLLSLFFVHPHALGPLFSINLFFMLNRMVQRFVCCLKVYGLKMAILSPLRIIFSNVINAFAGFKATYQYINYRVTGRPPRWVKTEHILLDGFGVDS